MNNKSSLIERFKNRSRPRKPWLLMVAGAMIVACFVVVFTLYQTGSNPAIKGKAKTRAMRSDVQSTPGGDASKEYREKIEELNKRQAENAEREGRSYMPSVAGQVSEEKPLKEAEAKKAETDPREAQQVQQATQASGQDNPEVEALRARMRRMQRKMEMLQRKNQQQQQYNAQQQRQPAPTEKDYSRQYGKQLARLSAEMDAKYTGQQVVVFEKTAATNMSGSDQQTSGADRATGAGAQASQSDRADRSVKGLKPGDILYTRNEVLLNSDAPGPAQATVLSGKFRGAKLLGGFDKSNDYLRVQFRRMILPDGTEYKVEGVGIDPEVSASTVRSDVNRHILSRWGGLMASSFLAGFGEAVQKSGTEIAVSDGTTVSSTPDLDTQRELWSAAGRVGEELSSVLKKNFDRPSTVKLEPGINIGVLILSAEKKEG